MTVNVDFDGVTRPGTWRWPNDPARDSWKSATRYAVKDGELMDNATGGGCMYAHVRGTKVRLEDRGDGIIAYVCKRCGLVYVNEENR